ncbi:MAG: magnesium transporter MgtE N-terminal domain-containing protein [Nitrososphaerales archaeon]
MKDYPLTDLPPEEIKSVLTLLDAENLSKVFENIPISDIKHIQSQLSNDEFDSILNKLPNESMNIITQKIGYQINPDPS